MSQDSTTPAGFEPDATQSHLPRPRSIARSASTFRWWLRRSFNDPEWREIRETFVCDLDKVKPADRAFAQSPFMAQHPMVSPYGGFKTGVNVFEWTPGKVGENGPTPADDRLCLTGFDTPDHSKIEIRHYGGTGTDEDSATVGDERHATVIEDILRAVEKIAPGAFAWDRQERWLKPDQLTVHGLTHALSEETFERMLTMPPGTDFSLTFTSFDGAEEYACNVRLGTEHRIVVDSPFVSTGVPSPFCPLGGTDPEGHSSILDAGDHFRVPFVETGARGVRRVGKDLRGRTFNAVEVFAIGLAEKLDSDAPRFTLGQMGEEPVRFADLVPVAARPKVAPAVDPNRAECKLGAVVRVGDCFEVGPDRLPIMARKAGREFTTQEIASVVEFSVAFLAGEVKRDRAPVFDFPALVQGEDSGKREVHVSLANGTMFLSRLPRKVEVDPSPVEAAAPLVLMDTSATQASLQADLEREIPPVATYQTVAPTPVRRGGPRR